ncbi:MAG: TonB-dependent receptor [Nitrospiraceae bacterium]|nr:TonB-dependent receptor [Nitrospiraceae bacterium]
MYRLCVIIFSLLIASSAAWAESKIKLEDVVVTATKVEESVEETTSAVTVIRGEDIRKTEKDFMPDILRAVPDLNVVQNGGPGKQATIYLRGGNSSHTLVLIDGVKVNSTTTGSFDFSGISIADIERIEIVKGPQSTIYGSEAMTGVVNIITRKGEGKPKVEFALETGAFGTYKPVATVSGGDKKTDYRVTGSYYYTKGISAAKEGTERDSYKNSTFSGRVGFKPADNFDVEVSGRYFYDRNDLDDFDFFGKKAVDNLNAVQYGNHLILSAKGRLYLFNIWEQVLTISTVNDVLKFRDPVVVFNNADITAATDVVDWQNNLYFSDAYTLTAGAEYRNEKGKNIGQFNEKIENKALYINNKLKLFGDRLVLNGGLRFDSHETFGDKLTYRVGGLYNFKDKGVRIKTSYGTGFRAPKFNELFFPFYGSINLKPEESSAWEAGIEKDLLKGRLTLSANYFIQDYKNLIQTDPLTFTAANIAKANVKGFEAEALFRVTNDLRLKAGYARLDTEDKTTGQHLSLRPRDKFTLAADLGAKDYSALISYAYVSKRFDSSIARDLSSYSLVNLSGSCKINKWLSVFGRIDNLFNTHYEESGTFGTPGFSVFGGVKITTL